MGDKADDRAIGDRHRGLTARRTARAARGQCVRRRHSRSHGRGTGNRLRSNAVVDRHRGRVRRVPDQRRGLTGGDIVGRGGEGDRRRSLRVPDVGDDCRERRERNKCEYKKANQHNAPWCVAHGFSLPSRLRQRQILQRLGQLPNGSLPQHAHGPRYNPSPFAMNKFYITTAIHYVNDDPHIGHMYENIVADVIARHRRRMGDDVWFLTGADEHGQKIERAAAKEGILPIELADRVVAKHHEMWRKLDLSHDDFIRTTEGRHRVGVLELIRRIQDRMPDDIYLGEHAGWYCQSEETFIPENQVRDGKDESGHPVEMTAERNFFFKLSRYTEPLLEHYRRNRNFVYPPTRMNEIVSFVEQGLKDLSISRTAVNWGIPFPGYPDHVVYVWMDALTNYISALGFGSADHARFDHDWPADIHLVGKDITRFHAVYWPAFLLAAGLPLPKQIVGHGWWLRDNQKISKSLGNVVRPYDIIDTFGADPFRYFLLREMVFGQDQNYSDEAFLARYNADLANDLGNTLSRALKMTDTYFGGKTPPVPCEDNELLRE